MPGETALARVSKYDFFAIFGSGTYVVASYGILATAVFKGAQKFAPNEALGWLSGIIERHWPIAVAGLFLAFLIGNVLRALPVNLLDNWWPGWLATVPRRKEEPPERVAYHQALWKSPFPYGDMLELELRALKKNHKDLDFAIPEEGTRHTMFNFWKAELCSESGSAFEYTQELEGRVRLFATMFWGALLGLVAGVTGLLLSVSWLLGPGWALLMASLVFLSALICIVFGSQLRRVRGLEVVCVFFAYVSLCLKRTRESHLSARKRGE